MQSNYCWEMWWVKGEWEKNQDKIKTIQHIVGH